MECGQCFPSQPFVVLTVDRFFGHGGGPKNWHIASDFSEKHD